MPRPRFAVPSIVREDIRDALAFTLARHGKLKAQEYALLTRLALRELARDPRAGHRRPDIHPDAWVYPIKRPGQPARHLFLYEIVDGRAQLYGFLYDAMDLPVQWEERGPQQKPGNR